MTEIDEIKILRCLNNDQWRTTRYIAKSIYSSRGIKRMVLPALCSLKNKKKIELRYTLPNGGGHEWRKKQ